MTKEALLAIGKKILGRAGLTGAGPAGAAIMAAWTAMDLVKLAGSIMRVAKAQRIPIALKEMDVLKAAEKGVAQVARVASSAGVKVGVKKGAEAAGKVAVREVAKDAAKEVVGETVKEAAKGGIGGKLLKYGGVAGIGAVLGGMGAQDDLAQATEQLQMMDPQGGTSKEDLQKLILMQRLSDMQARAQARYANNMEAPPVSSFESQLAGLF